MRALFDAQLEEIYSILDSQLSYLASNKPTKYVVSNKCLNIGLCSNLRKSRNTWLFQVDLATRHTSRKN